MEIEWRRDGSRLLIPIQILRPSPTSDLSSFDATALLDTGATASGVARHIAEQMALPSIGKEPINTAGGTVLVNRYLFRIAFSRDQGFPFVFDDLTGFELISHASFQAILGMDVLSRCDFSMTRDGRCTLRLN